MNLSDLADNDKKSRHFLSGVDQNNEEVQVGVGEDGEDAQSISFIFDNIVYTAIEDPEDGYRSCMREIIVSAINIKNKFLPVEVDAIHAQSKDEDILRLLDVKTEKVVLEVGTDNMDDYYPIFVDKFFPENMSVNSNANVHEKNKFKFISKENE